MNMSFCINTNPKHGFSNSSKILRLRLSKQLYPFLLNTSRNTRVNDDDTGDDAWTAFSPTKKQPCKENCQTSQPKLKLCTPVLRILQRSSRALLRRKMDTDYIAVGEERTACPIAKARQDHMAHRTESVLPESNKCYSSDILHHPRVALNLSERHCQVAM